MADTEETDVLPTFLDDGVRRPPTYEHVVVTQPPALEDFVFPESADTAHAESATTAYGQQVPRTVMQRVASATGRAVKVVARGAQRLTQDALKRPAYYRRHMDEHRPNHRCWDINAILAKHKTVTLEYLCKYVLKTNDPLDLLRPNIRFRPQGAYMEKDDSMWCASYPASQYVRVSKRDLDFFFHRMRKVRYEHLRDYAGISSFMNMMEAGFTAEHLAALGFTFESLITQPQGALSEPLITLEMLQTDYVRMSNPDSDRRTIPSRITLEGWTHVLHMHPRDLATLRRLNPTHSLVGNVDYMHTFGIRVKDFMHAFDLLDHRAGFDGLSDGARRLAIDAGLMIDEVVVPVDTKGPRAQDHVPVTLE